MDIALPGGRVAKPKNIPEGIKAIFDQLTDIHKVLKTGAGISAVEDEGNNNNGGSGGSGVTDVIISTAVGALTGIFRSAIMSGLAATGSFISAAFLPTLALAATGVATYYGDQLIAPLNIGFSDVKNAIMNGTSVADENAKRVEKVFEKEVDERQKVTQATNAYSENVELDAADEQEKDRFAKMLKEGRDIDDMPPWAQDIMKNLEDMGMDTDTIGFGEDDVTFKKFGIDNVNLSDLTPEQVDALFKASKVQAKMGDAGHAVIDEVAEEKNNKINEIGERQEEQREMARQAKANALYGTKKDNVNMDLTKANESSNIEAKAQLDKEAVSDGMVDGHRKIAKDPELSKIKDADQKKIGDQVTNGLST